MPFQPPALIGKSDGSHDPSDFAPKRKLASMGRAEIRRIVDQLMRQYGDKAELAAERRADAMLSRGDIEGCQRWTGVADAIRDLSPELPIDHRN